MPSIEQLTRLLAADPHDVFLNFGLAMEYAKQNRVDEAIAQFQRVTELDPNYPTAYFQWAKLLLAQGRHADAREMLLRGQRAADAAGDRHARTEMQELLDAIPKP